MKDIADAIKNQFQSENDKNIDILNKYREDLGEAKFKITDLEKECKTKSEELKDAEDEAKDLRTQLEDTKIEHRMIK